MKLTTLSLLMSALLAGAENYSIVARYPVPGTGGWDYVTSDSDNHRLYLSHATQVEVLDSNDGKVVGVIPDTPGVHGIAIANDLQRGFTSNGKENKVTMFDIASLKVLAKIPVGDEPDGIYYNSRTHRVFTNNHGTHDITAIDATTGKVVGTVKAEGDGEQSAVGANGLIYLNLEDKAEVIVFDPKTLEVKNRFPILGGKTPTGLAMDQKNNRLFVACRSKSLIVMDAGSGKKIASFPIGGNVDWAEFDPATSNVLTSNGEGTLTVIHQKSADDYDAPVNVPTQPSAKTMAFDPKQKRLFLPAAEVKTIPASGAQKAQRKTTPGSFVVLVMEKR